jgi:perosamine synthetase
VLAEGDIEAALGVLRSGEIAESEPARELESKAAAMLDRQYSWATASGTAALYSAFLCMGIGQGDEVLVPTYVCDDVLSAVLQAGATPVPVDVDPTDLNPDFHDARSKSGPRTRAVVLAHTLGMPARVTDFIRAGMTVIEDCAHGLGGQLSHDHPAGSAGDCTVLSFHGLKMVTAGQGGMVLTNDDEVAERYRRLRDPDFGAGQYRLHSRLANVLAAIASQQLERLDETVERRRHLAGRYLSDLSDLAKARPVPMQAGDGRRSSCYRFALITQEGISFEQVERGFLDAGVIVRRPIKQLCHRTMGITAEACPNAERIFDRVVSLPLYPNLTDEEQSAVITAARKVLR